MKRYTKWLSALCIVLLLVLSTLSAAAKILPDGASAGGDGVPAPTEDLMPNDGMLPDAAEDMLPRLEDGVIRDGSAIDGRVDQGNAQSNATDAGGISATVWGVIIAVGIAALAVVFIFLLMPRDTERKRGGEGRG